MKMRNYLIGFIIAMVSIIPISSIKADFNVTLNNGEELVFADLPVNDNEEYSIFKTSDNKYILFSHSDIENRYFALEHMPAYGNSQFFLKFQRIDLNTSTSSSYKYYIYSNNAWGTEKNISVTGSARNLTYKLVQVVYSTTDLIFLNDYNSNFSFVSNSNFDVNTWSANDIVYFSDKNKSYLSFDYEFINNSYYSIRFYSDNFNFNYRYQIKFDYNDLWVDITNYLSKGNFSYTLTKNSTLYMQVLDENNNSIETKTMTFADITYDEEYYLPTADINVSYVTDNNDFSKANITINVNNFSTLYYYKYSFNDIEDINIYSTEFVDNKYSFDTYQNGTLYFYIYNAEGNIIFETSKQINQIIDNGLYYYYEFDIEEFYNSEDNSVNTLMFYYKEGETLENNKKIIPYVNIYLKGNDNKILPFYITHSINVFDVNSYSRNISFSNVVSQFLPYEKLFNNNISYRDNSYTAYAIAPIMDLTNNTIEDYNDYKVVIRTNKKMSDNYFSFIGGIMLPQPIINNDLEESFNSKYSGFFDIFINAFNRFKNVIIEIFQHCTYFFNTISPIIQDFYITVFVLILFIFIIRFIL